MIRTGSWVLFSAVLLAAGAVASACSSGPAHGGTGGSGAEAGACQGADCGSAGQAGESSMLGSGGEAGEQGDSMPTACVPQGKTDAPDDTFTDSNCDGIDGDKAAAVFVSPSGDDEASGAFGAPVKSLTKGVALAASSGKAVYACVADYAETVVIDTKAVSIFGGYDCTDWSRSNARPTVKPTAGIALTVRNASGVTVDRVVFVAANATDPGASSIAAQIAASDHVTLSHLELDAGDGASGLAGGAVTGVAKPAQDGANGAAGDYCNNTIAGSHCTVTASSGGDGPATTCGGTSVYGGTGGAAAPYPSGSPILGYAGAPGKKRYGAAGGNGAAGGAGAAAGRGFGTVNETGYTPSNSGADGLVGGVGQSGGGGNGGYSCRYEAAFQVDAVSDCIAGVGQDTFYYGSGGGQGGYAGCGGPGGLAGGGGGASIALLSINSIVALSWSSLTTGNGGAGGVPTDGVDGQPGGAGGKAGKPTIYASGTYASLTTGEDGGPGGDGGRGGPGGPGGGGPSVTVVALGTTPTTEAVTFTPGAGGTGAPGLAGQDGASGESKEVEVVGVYSSAAHSGT